MNLTRRSFIKGAAAAGALGLSNLGLASAGIATVLAGENGDIKTEALPEGVPAWLGAEPQVNEADIVKTYDTNLLIIGAGNGGMMAAVRAADAGVDFRIVEQNNVVGDTRGWYGAINSKDCLDAGLSVDTALLRSEASRYASGKIDQRVLNVWINESAAMHDYVKPIMESYGNVCEFTTDTGVPETNQTQYYCPPEEHFYHAPKEGEWAGKKRNVLFQDYLEKRGYYIDFGYGLVKLDRQDGRVTGAVFQSTTENTYIRINARHGVLLATGGYAANPDMIEALNPIVPACVTASSYSPSTRGMGIKAGLWAGAQMDLQPAAMIFDRGIVAPGVNAGYVTDETGFKKLPGTVRQFNPGTQPFLKVNRDGERFANESAPYNDICHAASRQKGGVYCQVFDSSILEDVQRFNTLGCSAQTRKMGEALMAPNGYVDKQIQAGLVKKADTLPELADMLGFEGQAKETFLKTVERYNELYDKQLDEDFGKPAYRLSALRKAPYYGLWLGGSLLTTIDGLCINADMQVLNKEGDAIPGLFATGDCAGSTFADNYPELFPGMCLGRNLTFALHIVNKLVADGMPTGVGPTMEAPKVKEGMTADKVKDGTYTAAGKGINGDIPVEVTVKDGKITAVTADISKETPAIAGPATPKLIDAIIGANGTAGVDAVSGATITGDGIIDAVNKALRQGL